MSAAMTSKAVNDDELEQNWEAEDVQISDNESVVSAGSEDEFMEDQDVELATAKRSRDADEDEDMPSDDEAPSSSKKQKTSPANSVKSNDKGLQKMTPAEHFEIVNKAYIKNRGGQLTILEASEGLEESHFVVPTGLGKHNLDQLPLYIRHVRPSWKNDFYGKGIKKDRSPYFLILCSSAVRATEIIKPLSAFKCKIAKLFGKHLKVSEQKEALQMYHPIAVGTPGRVKKLLETEALSLQHTSHVILDMARDKKTLTILDLNDTAPEVSDILHYYLLPRLRANKTKLLLY